MPVLLVAPRLSPRRAAAVGFVASAIGGLNLLAVYPDVPAALLLVVVVSIAIPGLVATWLWRVLDARSGPVASVLTYPALVTASEYAVSLISPHGSFGSVAYSQADFLPLVQIASLTGWTGVSFAVSLMPAAIAVAWNRRRAPRVRWLLPAAAFAVEVAALAVGALRLRGDGMRTKLTVGLAASDTSSIHYGATSAAEALSVLRQYAMRVELLADSGAQVVVLPEKFVGVTSQYADSAIRVLGDVAARRHVTIVAGINRTEPAPPRNVAVVLGPDGAVALNYSKVHLIGGLEQGYVPGNTAGTFLLGRNRAGVAICKDLDFPGFARRYASQGTELMLVPAWDFERDGWLHSRMAVMRGVEGGYAMARSATRGRLTVSDGYGRIVAERASSSTAEPRLVTMVSAGPRETIYGRYGDWFPLLCAVVIAVTGCRRASSSGRVMPGST